MRGNFSLRLELTWKRESLSGGAFALVAHALNRFAVISDASETDQAPQAGKPCYLAIYPDESGECIACGAPEADYYVSDPETAKTVALDHMLGIVSRALAAFENEGEING